MRSIVSVPLTAAGPQGSRELAVHTHIRMGSRLFGECFVVDSCRHLVATLQHNPSSSFESLLNHVIKSENTQEPGKRWQKLPDQQVSEFMLKINLLLVELCFIKHKMESCVQGALLAVACGVVRYGRVFDSGGV